MTHHEPNAAGGSAFPTLVIAKGGEHLAASTLRRFDELCGSEVIHARFVRHSFALHMHDTWTIGWVEQGANHFRRNRSHLIAGPGALCVVNPGEVHTGGGDEMTYWNLTPSHALLARIFPNTPAQRLFLRDSVVTGGSAVASVRNMFILLGRARSSMEREQAVVDGLVGLFTTGQRLAADDARRDKQPSAARIARDFIEAHLDERISLASLAAATGLSLFHVCRVFESTYHMPPAAYVRCRRVHRAGQLIVAGTSLAAAAAAAGFADQPHMTRQFRAVLGVTPAQWRD
jgi:AraC-like DNA-binding protein